MMNMNTDIRHVMKKFQKITSSTKKKIFQREKANYLQRNRIRLMVVGISKQKWETLPIFESVAPGILCLLKLQEQNEYIFIHLG